MAKTTARRKEFGADLGLVHQAVVAGRKFGADEEFWKKLAEDGVLYRRVVQLVNGVQTPAGCTTPEEAARIMDGNFHGVEAVKSYFGYRFNAAQRRALLNVPFSVETLEACKDSHVLAAIAPLSIMDVHAKAVQHFYSRTDPWYAEATQKFAHTKAQPGWYLVRKDHVPGSTGKNWGDQRDMLDGTEFVPSAAVVVQVAVLHFLQTSNRLFSSAWVRTDDVSAVGYRVGVLFRSDGLYVNYWGDDAVHYIGVAAARKSS